MFDPSNTDSFHNDERIREETASGLQIRRASMDDAAAIASVLYRSFLEYESSYTPEAFAATTSTPAQIRERISEGPIWVALRNGIIIGTVAAVVRNEGLYVRGMAVAPAVRGGRIGYRLLKCVEDFAIEQGCARLFLSTTPFLMKAIRLYEQSGFRRGNEGPHELMGTPLFTMTKNLAE
jgi:N-acetylglutamate synthase-like GNAT family acetyltransferase